MNLRYSHKFATAGSAEHTKNRAAARYRTQLAPKPLVRTPKPVLHPNSPKPLPNLQCAPTLDSAAAPLMYVSGTKCSQRSATPGPRASPGPSEHAVECRVAIDDERLFG